MLARAMECDLVPDSPYIAEMGHKISGDFVPAARALVTDEAGQKLMNMLDIDLKLHEQYNLPKARTDYLEAAVRKQIRGICGK